MLNGSNGFRVNRSTTTEEAVRRIRRFVHTHQSMLSACWNPNVPLLDLLQRATVTTDAWPWGEPTDFDRGWPRAHQGRPTPVSQMPTSPDRAMATAEGGDGQDDSRPPPPAKRRCVEQAPPAAVAEPSRPRRARRPTQWAAEDAKESDEARAAKGATTSAASTEQGAEPPCTAAVRRRACLPCHRAKTRCLGGWPCTRCYRHCFECSLPPEPKRRAGGAAAEEGADNGAKEGRSSGSIGEAGASSSGYQADGAAPHQGEEAAAAGGGV